MKIDVIVENKIKEIAVKIYTSKNDEKVSKIVKKLEEDDKEDAKKINVYQNRELVIMELQEINSFYTELGHTYAKAIGEEYRVKKKLYELEEILKRYIIYTNIKIRNYKYK